MPTTKNERKTVRAFRKQYGAKRGRSIFFARINKMRTSRRGGRWLRAIGKGAVRAARSGGRGRTAHRRTTRRR